MTDSVKQITDLMFRYAELFDYDAGHRRFILPDVPEDEIAATGEAK